MPSQLTKTPFVTKSPISLQASTPEGCHLALSPAQAGGLREPSPPAEDHCPQKVTALQLSSRCLGYILQKAQIQPRIWTGRRGREAGIQTSERPSCAEWAPLQSGRYLQTLAFCLGISLPPRQVLPVPRRLPSPTQPFSNSSSGCPAGGTATHATA